MVLNSPVVNRSLLWVVILAILVIVPISSYASTDPSSSGPSDPAAAPEPSTAPVSLTIAAPTAAPEPRILAERHYSISGILDGYGNYDFNDPSGGNTQLRNFDLRADAVSLTEAKLVFAYDPAPFGVRADIGLGSLFETMHPDNPSGGALKYVEQMFVTAKPTHWKGFEADFGQFVTSAGAEVADTVDNWNYSRSLLFSYAIPYYHFGLRTSMPVTSSLTVGAQVVQGWNNIFDNNSGKTIGLTAAQTKKYYTLSGNYYVGPENSGTTHGYRNLFDTTLLLTPTAKLNAYINYDYGQNRNANATFTGTGSLAHWQGVAGAVHVQATSKLGATVRSEYYSDNNGFTTGLAQTLTELTLTGEYLIHPGVLVRGGYRRDHSNRQYFDMNNIPGSAYYQSTFEVGLIGFFGPKT